MNLQELLGFHLSFLVLGLLFVRLVKLDLIKYTGLYAILVAIKAVLGSLLIEGFDTKDIITIAAIGVIGAVFVVVMSGVLGERLNTDSYASLMFGMGLFPWYLGLATSLAYVFTSAAIIMIVSEFRSFFTLRKLGARTITARTPKRLLNESDYVIYKQKASVVFATHIAIAAIVSALLFSS